MQRSSFIPNPTWLNKRSRAPAYTSQLVTVPAGYNLLACLTFFGSVDAPSQLSGSFYFFRAKVYVVNCVGKDEDVSQ